MCIFNGVADLARDFTCIHHNGNSVVDYMCGRQLPTSLSICRTTLGTLSDHCVLECRLRLPSLLDPALTVPVGGFQRKYRWVSGALGSEEGVS